MEASTELFIAYGAVLTMALIPIYIGSKRALLNQTAHSTNDNFSRPFTQQETMTTKDAYMFPLVGSCVLVGLYVLFKFFSQEHLNLLVTAYFFVLGLGALAATISPWLEDVGHFIFGQRKKKSKPFKIQFTPFWSKEKISISFTFLDALSVAIGAAIAGWYAYEKHWIANNMLGLAFCIQAIAMWSLGSYKIGLILLSGLFVYDIFWVFGTDVMVTVAKSFNAPVKLVFPRNILTTEKFEFSMLGLGDIVIPGIFIALLLRFDSHRQSNKKSFSAVYFWVTFIGYFGGLATTIGVMHVFRAAQPALLYLVPACICSSFLTAVMREEIGLLFAYTENDEEKKSNQKQKNQSKKSKQNKKGKQAKTSQETSEKKKTVKEVAVQQNKQQSKQSQNKQQNKQQSKQSQSKSAKENNSKNSKSRDNSTLRQKPKSKK